MSAIAQNVPDPMAYNLIIQACPRNTEAANGPVGMHSGVDSDRKSIQTGHESWGTPRGAAAAAIAETHTFRAGLIRLSGVAAVDTLKGRVISIQGGRRNKLTGERRNTAERTGGTPASLTGGAALCRAV
ncbi:hypothetical protein SRHO_G00077260 [Serrasalmus rhombeus]